MARAFHHTLGLRLAVTTSGLTLGYSGVRQELIAHYEQVTLSIDGLGRFHDQVRREPGFFEHLRSSIARLKAEDREGRLRLRVNTILMRGNIAAFSGFCAEMADWGFRELTFNPLGGIERPEFYRVHHLLPDQVTRFREDLPGLRSAMARRGLHIRGTESYLHRMACTAAGERVAVEGCQPGRRLLFIDEFGRAGPCSLTCGDYGVPLAALDSPGVLETLPARWSRLQQETRAAACNDCHATHVFAKFDKVAV